MNYNNYEEYKGRLSALIGKVVDVLDASGYGVTDEGFNHAIELKIIRKRLDKCKMRMLVIGTYGSGSRTFINGLLGKKMMPMLLPADTVHVEIKYAANERVVLTPKPGKWEYGDEPFELRIAELDKYLNTVLLENSHKEYPFSHICFEYPSSICKKGIEIDFFQGLYDTSNRGEIVESYNPDVILYCMRSTYAFSSIDKDTIDFLRAMGYKAIIFVLTYFDAIIRGDEMMGTHEAEEVKNHYYKVLSPLTELGKSGIFFVGSLDAIKGKMNNDTELLGGSGFLEVEDRIEQIFFEEKGRHDLIHSLYQVKRINRQIGSYLRNRIEMILNGGAINAGELIQAENSLSAAINDIAGGAKDKGELFVMNNLVSSIDLWVNEFEPMVDVSALRPKTSFQNYVNAHFDHIETKISVAFAEWCDNTLINDYIKPYLERILTDSRVGFNQFEEEISQMRKTLVFSIMGNAFENGGKQVGSDSFTLGMNSSVMKRELKKRIVERVKEILSSRKLRYEFGERVAVTVRDSLIQIQNKVHNLVDESTQLVVSSTRNLNEDGAGQDNEIATLQRTLQEQEKIEGSLDELSVAIV